MDNIDSLIRKINRLEKSILALTNKRTKVPKGTTLDKPVKSNPNSIKVVPSSKLAKRTDLIKGTINPASKVLAKVYSHVFSDTETSMFVECVEEASGYFNHLIKHRGLREGTKRFKDVRLYTIKTLLGVDVEHVPCLSTYKDGFPKDVRSIRRYFKHHPDYIRIVNTILSISRLTSNIDKLIDTESVTRQPDRNENFKLEVANFEDALPGLFASLQIPIDQNVRKIVGDNIQLHYTSKNGPNSLGRGLDALESAHIDAYAVTCDKQVSYNLLNYLTLVDRKDVWEYLVDLGQSFKPDGIEVICSKLAVIEQPENKQRVVAMFDYFSQASLLPLHEYLCEITKKLPNSYVYDQDKGRELVKQFTDDNEALPQSEDASNWTDRFPLELQCSVLKTLFNKEYARLTRLLLVDRRFAINGRRNPVMYGAGQPMGAYPSFSLANLTHCLYIYWKLSKHGEDPVRDSAVCGDDVAFRHLSEGFKEYVVGMNSLGVRFNKTKGFSSQSSDLRIAEFCKRLYINGKDISPLSPKVASLAGHDFMYAGLLYDFIQDDSRFEDWIAKYDDKKKVKASRLFKLPKFISGIDRKIDFRLEQSLSVFGFSPDMEMRTKYNILFNVCLFELFIFATGETEDRLNAYYEPSLAIGPFTETRSNHLIRSCELMKGPSFSRLHLTEKQDDSNDQRILDFSRGVKRIIPLVSKESIHPLLCVIRNTLIPNTEYIGEQAALLYMPSDKILYYKDFFTMEDPKVLDSMVDCCLSMINKPTEGQVSRQLMQRESSLEKRRAQVGFVVGSRIVDHISKLTEVKELRYSKPL